MNNNESGVNTILLVIVIAALVGGIVWLYTRNTQTADDKTTNIEVTIPNLEEGATPE